MFISIAILITVLISLQVLRPIYFDSTWVQDDFRQSSFGLWRYWDPELYKDDFFIPMYEFGMSRVPIVHLFYKLAPNFTDDLILATKFLVLIIVVLTGVAAYLFFKALLEKYPSFDKYMLDFKFLGMELNTRVVAAWAFTALMVTTSWCTDHLSAAHGRSFIWFGILFFMYLKLIDRDHLATLFNFILLLLSPITFLICFAMDFYSGFIKHGLKYFSPKNLSFVYWLLVGFATAFMYLVLLKDVKTQGVGKPFSVEEMKQLAEFNPGGRHPIFGSSLWDGTWWANEHWGFGLGYLTISNIVIYALVCIAIFLLFHFYYEASKKKETPVFYSGLVEVSRSIPASLFYASISLYFAAQIIFPTLYLPSRYISTPAIVLALIVLELLFIIWIIEFFGSKPSVYLALFVALGGAGFWYHYKGFYHTRYVHITPEVNRILAATPKDSMLAAHPMLPDINVASITAKRKVFIDYERSMAYTKQSLDEIRRRNQVALKMCFAKTKQEFLQLANENGITHFLALHHFYRAQYRRMPLYMEPYNELLRNLVRYEGKFFLQQMMEDAKQAYMIIDIAKLQGA